MQDVWFVAALWLALALISTMLSIWFRIATALSEIVVGTVAQLIIGALIGTQVLGGSAEWITRCLVSAMELSIRRSTLT
jgi:glutathione-regulated potassium-efflux system ancillary protein KefC